MDSYGCGDNAVIGAVTGQLRQHLIHENASQTFLRKNICIFWLHVPVNECFFFRCQPHEIKLLVREGTLVASRASRTRRTCRTGGPVPPGIPGKKHAGGLRTSAKIRYSKDTAHPALIVRRMREYADARCPGRGGTA